MLRTRLVVAADGKHSLVRKKAHLPTLSWVYHQVESSFPHSGYQISLMMFSGLESGCCFGGTQHAYFNCLAAIPAKRTRGSFTRMPHHHPLNKLFTESALIRCMITMALWSGRHPRSMRTVSCTWNPNNSFKSSIMPSPPPLTYPTGFDI